MNCTSSDKSLAVSSKGYCVFTEYAKILLIFVCSVTAHTDAKSQDFSDGLVPERHKGLCGIAQPTSRSLEKLVFPPIAPYAIRTHEIALRGISYKIPSFALCNSRSTTWMSAPFTNVQLTAVWQRTRIKFSSYDARKPCF